MGFFKRLFGKESDESSQTKTALAYTPKDPREDPEMIRIFDSYGRELFIAKEEWRKNVLPSNLKANWNDADALYGMIVDALNHGLAADVLAACEQFRSLDRGSLRSTCLYAITLREVNRLDEAEQVLRSYLEQHGQDGIALTNLAKVHAARGKAELGEATLWHAMEIDPNQEGGFVWYDTIHRGRGGDTGALEAMRRLASLPGSWRAQLWLARVPLAAGDIEQALQLYRDSLARAPKPVPAELLMHMSGDLGMGGHIRELVGLTKPYFDARVHGLEAGNNLIKAHLELGQIEAAHEIVEQLYACNRPDWTEHLSFWDTEIAKARVENSPVDQNAPLQMAMLSIHGPVWLAPESPMAGLFDAHKAEAPVVHFLGSSAEMADSPQHIEKQLTDAPGRLSRALPLFLAEQVQFATSAESCTVIPWLVGAQSGFVFSGAAWSDEWALKSGQGEESGDFIVITHLKCREEPWSIELRLIRTADEACVGRLAKNFDGNAPGEAVRELAGELVAFLHRENGFSYRPTPDLYQLPGDNHLSEYLLRLEQLLAVRCAALEDCNPQFLYGEREIIEGNLRLCLAYPASAVMRILLTQTLASMKKIRPTTVAEFQHKVMHLQEQEPLPEPANASIQRALEEVFAM